MKKEEYWLFTFSCSSGVRPERIKKITQIFDCFPEKASIERALGTTDYSILFMTPITKEHTKLLLGQKVYNQTD